MVFKSVISDKITRALGDYITTLILNATQMSFLTLVELKNVNYTIL